MAYIICEPCINVKDRACVEACPVDCIHPREDEDQGEIMLYIHPDECIDCGACEPVCPVNAIFFEDDVPEQWKHFIEMNRDYYELSPEEFEAKYGRRPYPRLERKALPLTGRVFSLPLQWERSLPRLLLVGAVTNLCCGLSPVFGDAVDERRFPSAKTTVGDKPRRYRA